MKLRVIFSLTIVTFPLVILIVQKLLMLPHPFRLNIVAFVPPKPDLQAFEIGSQFNKLATDTARLRKQNVTIRKDIVYYNRVPKCGSSTFLILIGLLSKARKLSVYVDTYKCRYQYCMRTFCRI